ncbi:MAG: protein kinase [Anaeromyxobacter sp.]
MLTQVQNGEPGPDGVALDPRSRQLTDLLAELVRTEERAVPEAWSGLEPGARVGRFELVRELGRGGFGVVWEARDAELGRAVALKVVRPGARLGAHGPDSLRREAEAVARLNHPGIVTLHDVGQGPGGVHLVFELLRGETLAERLKRGPLQAAEAARLGAAVAAALRHAHAAGVLHRDLTPGNVHLGEDGQVKVLDFGLSHLFGREGASDGGTAAYMAPEQWRAEAGDARTDLFALGVILFEALGGRTPYEARSGRREVLEQGRTPALPRAAAPGALRSLVRRLLEREPDRRPASAADVVEALARLGARGRRLRRWLFASALAACALAGGAGLRWWTARPPPPTVIPEAARAYEEGMDCLRRAPGIAGASEACIPAFERALAHDPGFGLAAYQRLVIGSLEGASEDLWGPLLATALATADRLPPLEARLLKARAAMLHERWDEAAQLYGEALALAPDDAEAVASADEVAQRRGDWVGVARLSRKRLQLRPSDDDALQALTEALGRLGRHEELRALVAELGATPDTVGRAVGQVRALVWYDPLQAVAVGRQAVVSHGDAGLTALRMALGTAGLYAEMEDVARRDAAAHPEDPWKGTLVAIAQATQGRLADALATSQVVADAVREPADRHSRDAMLTVVSWDPRRVRRSAEQTAAVDPLWGVDLALPLGLLGDVEGARHLGAAAPPGSVVEQELQALLAWREGDVNLALAMLAAAEERDSRPVHGVSPAYLLAEVASAAGEHRTALAAARRFLELPSRGMWRCWAYPRALLLRARAEAATGQPQAARGTAAQLRALWARADPGLPLLRELDALEAALERGGAR